MWWMFYVRAFSLLPSISLTLSLAPPPASFSRCLSGDTPLAQPHRNHPYALCILPYLPFTPRMPTLACPFPNTHATPPHPSLSRRRQSRAELPPILTPHHTPKTPPSPLPRPSPLAPAPVWPTGLSPAPPCSRAYS